MCSDMCDLTTNTIVGDNESKRISCLVDTKYYDELITNKHLQAREEHERSIQSLQQQQKIQEKGPYNQKRKKRILLVDDEPDHCMVYQIVLEDAGYQCISYTDSVKALQEFKPSYYDLVMLDIKMPKLDGFALCEKIRELDKNIQIIFVTASEMYYENFRKQYYPEIGIDANINCLQKPITNEELIKIVNMTIATKYAK
jgi:two-component system alkaline phosphatase synthesis response regulator PhoP